MTAEDLGAASQIVLDLCTVAEGPAPYLRPKWPRGLVGSLAECSRALHLKLFEVKFPSAIDVVESVSFLNMHDSFRLLSEMAPFGLVPPTLESCVHQDIHLGGIFATFGLVCEVCYVYHPYNDLLMARADEAYPRFDVPHCHALCILQCRRFGLPLWLSLPLEHSSI